ncbi:ABC transporter permease subunit [Acetobacterium paludosum]|uniref:ABC transporter permease subunit n=1 Tax=Acetobacterium paludosum TaxID=52693 RepID=A0A923HUS6_9FIRM|nr:ABC transporter permease [Acetobacterium paludosum]MBC3888953.1 ABC transporter permease subunit [Acetobacterium paludosum]
MLSIVKRILGQIKNDKRSLGLLLFAPLLVLTLLYFILGNSNYVPQIATYDMSEKFITELQQNAGVIELNEKPEAKNYLEENGIDALIWKDSEGTHIELLEKNSKSATALKAIQDTNKVLQPSQSELLIEYVYETADDNQLDSLSYVFLGVISFFFVFILSGMSFVRERFGQTLERMLMTPISRMDIIGGYTFGYGLLSALQSVVIILFSVYVLHLHVEGSVSLCILVMILMAFSAVSVGALVSIFANNELQMVQFIPVVLIPQIFFSGLIPIDTIPFGLGNLCYFTPIYYGCTSLEMIMIQGKGFMEIWPWLVGSVLFIGVLFIVNVMALKKYRRL